MSALVISTFDDPFYSMTLILEGTAYVFEMRYNQREGVNYLSVSLEDGTRLVTGIKVVCGVNLLARCADHRKPPGLLTAIPNGADDGRPGLTELGEDRRVVLTYFTSDERKA